LRTVEGWVWGWAVSSPVAVWGLAPRKKINFALKQNYAILSKFWYFFPTLQHKNVEKVGGGLSPVLKVGDLSPCRACPPCSDAYDNGPFMYHKGWATPILTWNQTSVPSSLIVSSLDDLRQTGCEWIQHRRK